MELINTEALSTDIYCTFILAFLGCAYYFLENWGRENKIVECILAGFGATGFALILSQNFTNSTLFAYGTTVITSISSSYFFTACWVVAFIFTLGRIFMFTLAGAGRLGDR